MGETIGGDDPDGIISTDGNVLDEMLGPLVLCYGVGGFSESTERLLTVQAFLALSGITLGVGLT